MTDHYKLTVITRALNGGWTPDWNNSGEYKYYPWFYCKDGFSFFLVDSHFTGTGVGSRLCFRNEEIAEYAATQFIDLYKSYFTINQ
ncbi:hypothetical protein JST56_07105 [Candidatus Dependentiae bacterium]|nr:hypothetical protein [Candidatus Dependentiae bacterium]